MSETQQPRIQLVFEGVEHNVPSLEQLPFDVLHQIISDLAFDKVIALIRTGSRHITECIERSIPYKYVFGGIRKTEDLKALADIITFCYEVSAYRYRRTDLCEKFAKAARNGTRQIRSEPMNDQHHKGFCRNASGLSFCTGDYQRPYQKGSVRGARWNRMELNKGTELPNRGTRPQAPYSYVPADNPQPGQGSDLCYDTDLWPNFYHRVLHKVKRRFDIKPDLKFARSESNKALLNGIYQLLIKPKAKDLLTVSELVSGSVHDFVDGLQRPPIAAVEHIIQPFEEFLNTHKKLELVTLKEFNRRVIADTRYVFEICGILDIFLQEIADYMIRPLISTFAIKQIEGYIYKKLQSAPSTAYLFFRHYYGRTQSPASRSWNVLFGEVDDKLADDGQFLLDSLQFTYQSTAHKDLVILTEIYEQHPYMLIKWQDPGKGPRRNVEHVRKNVAARAKKYERYDPFTKLLSARSSSLLRGPGLPLIPVNRLLSLFLETLALCPLNLEELSADQRFALSKAETELRIKLRTPDFHWKGEGDHLTSNSSDSSDASPSLAAQGQRNSNNDKLYENVLACLSGILEVYTGGQADGPERVMGDFAHRDLKFNRRACSLWEDGRIIAAGGYDQKEFDWLRSFLECCQSFASQTPPKHPGWIEMAQDSWLEPGSRSEEVIKARLERKMRRM